VARNANATVSAQTAPGASCSITVNYASGPSGASGLEAKTASASGAVSWTWKVGANTTPGNYTIVVKATKGGATTTKTVSFTVI
jgi:hypothetical protein